jgi:hypothetical protein
MIFDYPDCRDHRRHWPRGYTKYDSYRPWLRDEFTFRCAYCLKREQWGHETGEFDIDHFQPQRLRPDLSADYENLVYACRRCNSAKSDSAVSDPFFVMCRTRVVTTADGRVFGVDAEAARLILILDLNSPRLVEWRVTWMRNIALAAEHDPLLLERLAGFPTDLPHLGRLRPPGGNARPDGIAESWRARQDQGTLPPLY